jgi:HK97 family phage major capsid protein
MELESKAFGMPDLPQKMEVKKAFEDFLGSFEAFKQSNDERLKGLERRSADVVQDEKVDRINKALENQQLHIDQLMLDAARPALGSERKSFDPRTLEKKQAFDRYVRKGDGGGLDALEIKAMSAGTPADGGYTVPMEIERTIDRVLAKASPVRSIATVRQIGGCTYRKPIVTGGAASGWTGETDAISSPTTTPTLAALDFPAMELYAMPAATQMLLDDSQVDIEQWLADEVQTVFAEQEGAAFVSGTGAANSAIRVEHTPGSIDDADFIYFTYNGTQIGGVVQAATHTAVTYATTSDARLKTVLPQQRDYRHAIRALWVGDFTWTASGVPGFGVLAQQAWEVMPHHAGVTPPDRADGAWQASAEPFAHLALWGVKDIYALVEALAARVRALEAAHAG